MSNARRFLHILNGDSAAEGLARSGVPGTIAVWADVLCEGPLPAAATDEERRRIRARYLALAGYTTEAEALVRLARWDDALAQAEQYEEVVLWFEHDLYDQVLLVRHLAALAPRQLRSVSLICIGSHPEVVPFHGLGQLAPVQLAALLPGRHPVTPAEVALGCRAWEAFTADTPEALQTLVEDDTSALPFLAGAIWRYLEEYPALDTGLSRTERQALEELRQGPRAPAELFQAVAGREERIFMGDSSFWRVLRELARPPAPLVQVDGELTAGFPAGMVSLTALGAEVLAGRADRARLLPIDRWMGGVRLEGPHRAWRWDPTRRRIVAGR